MRKSDRKDKNKKKDKSTMKKDPKDKGITTTKTTTTINNAPYSTRSRKRSVSEITSIPAKRSKVMPPPSRTYFSDSDSDSTDNESYERSTPLPTKYSQISVVSPIIKKENASKPSKYSSDSDSDSTDHDSKSRSSTASSIKHSIPKPSTVPAPSYGNKTNLTKPTKYTSDSDSDSTDNDSKQQPAATAAATPSKRYHVTTLNTSVRSATTNMEQLNKGHKYSSDSDSDSADNNDHRHPIQLTKNTSMSKSLSTTLSSRGSKQQTKRGVPRSSEYIMDSDSSDNDTTTYKTNPEKVAMDLINNVQNGKENNTSDSSSSDDNETVTKRKIRQRGTGRKGTDEYIINRLQSRGIYRDKNKHQSEDYKRRFIDEADKYDIHHDFFISDSESDTDSNDSYSEELLPWHAICLDTSRLRKKVGETNWKVNSNPITRAEEIRLEKRIKKICRRQNYGLEDFQGILAAGYGSHRRLWQMILKPFPDRAAKMVIEWCNRKYNKYGYSGQPWTDEMTKQLKEYLKIYGRRYGVIEEKMKRPRDEIKQRALALKDKNKKHEAIGSPWSEEEKEKLIQVITETRQKGWTSFKDIAKRYFPTRTAAQCNTQWQKRNANKTGLSIDDKLAVIQQMKKTKLKAERDLKFEEIANELGVGISSTLRSFYIKIRSTIPKYETMNLPDTLNILEKRLIQMKHSLEE
ncbi:uncharacterized protein BX664DRAFT_339571 [Halteromyces radiatus]|uniref:uncharacterized protein n=1 Tax=Halteromyces radiatus TaxID=101107 RepID=UPI00221F44EF|nr:uncharacterized protein BX664DRAFT_339571 [Halteromyces radiatus]KAI8082993.1 hypothetical protein BX664DRAFT_339571 [Halteromyces radiatus]